MTEQIYEKKNAVSTIFKGERGRLTSISSIIDFNCGLYPVI